MSDDHVDFDLKRKLQFEGMFLDPEKYDPVRMLGSGGFGKVKAARGNVQNFVIPSSDSATPAFLPRCICY